MKNPVFANIKPAGKLLLLLGLVLLFGIVFSLTGLLAGKWYLNVDLTRLAALISTPEGKALKFALFFQFMSQLGVFIFPALVYGFFVSSSPWSYLKLNKKSSAVSLLIVTLAVYAVLPFINYLSELNNGLHLSPAIDDWIRMKELQARELTEAFLKTKSAGRLVVNLLVMAVIPAIGEEMLFRGIVQRLFTAMVKNVHLGVIITAFLFSAFHLQFLGFLPRFFLGLMLGYAFVITGSLWTSVWLHFVNNASSVMVFYLHYNGFLKVSMDDFGNTQNMVYIIGSLLMAVWLFIMMYNKEGGEVRMKYFEKG
jgi:membrane protease YdiL (CAAX protease family)